VGAQAEVLAVAAQPEVIAAAIASATATWVAVLHSVAAVLEADPADSAADPHARAVSVALPVSVGGAEEALVAAAAESVVAAVEGGNES